MLIDAIPYGTIDNAGSAKPMHKAVVAFVTFLEKRLGAKFLIDMLQFPLGRPELIQPFRLGALLMKGGVITGFGNVPSMSDEPRIHLWRATCATAHSHVSGGISVASDNAALTAALAEALERFLWYETNDYFRVPLYASFQDIGRKFLAIQPGRFAGSMARSAEAANRFLWIQAESLLSRKQIYIPAQVVSARHAKEIMKEKTEDVIRPPITTGLATWTTKNGAILRGALEIIERDAFMIMWLNRLSLPRVPLHKVRPLLSSLDTLLQRCAQYRLEVEAIRLLTDAPASVVCVVVRDLSSVGPVRTLGLKAHASLPHAIEAALLEALRARTNVRTRAHEGLDHSHQNILYWSDEKRHAELAFLTAAPVLDSIEHGVWEKETDEDHLQRVIEWCRGKEYEFASVSLGLSKKNPTSLHVEMTVIPELQPLYKRGATLSGVATGERVREIPRLFGYTPAETMSLDEPHPFV